MNNQLKDISQWDSSYVLALPAGEYDWIDFKDSRWLDFTDSCLEKLSKYISAFANYDGGYLVIGVRNPKPGQGIEIDGGVPLGSKPDLKGWLEDVIPNLTDPPIQRLNVHLITDTAGSIAPDHVLVVIYIYPSEKSPHQARDHKYYTRIGTKLAAIGNQAVLDILNRKRNPVVQTQIYINIHPSGNKHSIFWRVTNNSAVFTRYVMTRIEMPIIIRGVFIKFPGNTMRVLDDGQTIWPIIASNHLAQPLFPHGTVARQFEFELRGKATPHQTPAFIRYQTFADHMPPNQGAIPIEEALNLPSNNKNELEEVPQVPVAGIDLRPHDPPHNQ